MWSGCECSCVFVQQRSVKHNSALHLIAAFISLLIHISVSLFHFYTSRTFISAADETNKRNKHVPITSLISCRLKHESTVSWSQINTDNDPCEEVSTFTFYFSFTAFIWSCFTHKQDHSITQTHYIYIHIYIYIYI